MHHISGIRNLQNRPDRRSNGPDRLLVPRPIVAAAAFVLVAAVAGLLPAQQPSQDKVVLQLKGTSSRMALYGTVVDYTGRQITVRNEQGTLVRTYDADEVVEVQTPQTEFHVKGLVSFAQGDVAEAARSFQKALTEERREWVRRDILALLVRCALRQGDYRAAGSRFLLLWQSDPSTRHFKLIPLAWSPQPSAAALQSAAASWLRAGGKTSKLLGASHLLADPRYGQLAQTELETLARSTDDRVQRLARAQLWRLRVREGDLAPSELNRWQRQIEEMPAALRGGPYYVLGRGYLRRQEYDRAAAALLWLPLVYDHDVRLAARACLEAADALLHGGKSSDAVRLYREVTSRFGGTEYAGEAASVLRSLSAGNADSEPEESSR